MTFPEHWVWWGLGWAFLPRFTFALLLYIYFNINDIAIVLMIWGFISDLSGDYNCKKK